MLTTHFYVDNPRHMDKHGIVNALAALAQGTRLDAFRLLVTHEPDGQPAGEIARLLGVPHNTMSTHLATLQRAGLVTAERQSRSIIYRANLNGLSDAISFLLKDCCGGNPGLCAPLIADLVPCCTPKEKAMSERIYNVLFLCTGNSARSILAESILNAEGKGRFKAYSAGSYPKGTVHPLALQELSALGYPTTGFSSKSWDVFAVDDAPQMDFIFTVCDNAAGEACPVWIGHPMTAHWGVEDPAAVEGSEFEKERAFSQAARFLKNRIMAFLALPHSSIDKLAMETRLHQIGAMEGASVSPLKAG
jgi:protein-tyrosine-phosphatase/DNA-binding transcriptional ArsR family regulator